jgi:hypothetical protein
MPRYIDQCSACKQPCTRLRRVSSRTGSARFVSACCGAKSIAVKVVEDAPTMAVEEMR